MLDMKHCVIVHGCPSDDTDPTYNKHRIPWTKSHLVSKGYTVDTPLMPKPWQPVYKDYKEIFEQYEVTENSILVGHSCGCAFLVRWLGETKQKVKKLILVALWKINDEGDKYRKEFYGYEIDPTLKERIGEIVLFTADNEEPEGKDSLKMYHEEQ